MHPPVWARYAAVVFVALIIQVTLAGRFRLSDVAADLPLLLAVAGGVVGGPERGAVVGFGAGLALDVVLPTPLGLAALAYCIVGFGVGRVQGLVLRSVWWIPMLTAAAASAAGVVIFAVVGEVVGQRTLRAPGLAGIVAIVAVLNAALSPLALRVVRWADDDGLAARPFA